MTYYVLGVISVLVVGVLYYTVYIGVEIPRKSKLIIDQKSVKKGAIMRAFFCSINNEVYLLKIIVENKDYFIK
jgi:hypothetical protein